MEPSVFCQPLRAAKRYSVWALSTREWPQGREVHVALMLAPRSIKSLRRSMCFVPMVVEHSGNGEWLKGAEGDIDKIDGTWTEVSIGTISGVRETIIKDRKRYVGGK